MQKGSSNQYLLIAAAGLALVASACSGDNRPADVEPGFIVWTEPIEGSLDAPVDGVVNIRGDGCVMLANEEGSHERAVIWPFETTFDGEVIRTKEGVEIRDGDHVAGGGGGVEASSFYIENTSLSVDLAIVQACVGQEDIRLSAFNPLPPIEVIQPGS